MLGCLAGNVAWKRGKVTEWEWEGGEEEEEQVRQPLMAKGRSRRWPDPPRGGGWGWGWVAPSPPPCSCSRCPFSPSPHGPQSAMAPRSLKICTVAVTLCFTPTGWSSWGKVSCFSPNTTLGSYYYPWRVSPKHYSWCVSGVSSRMCLCLWVLPWTPFRTSSSPPTLLFPVVRASVWAV